MNILVINRWVGYNEGGNESHIKDVINQFIKCGHKISVITTKGDALKTFGDKIETHYIDSPQKYFSYGLGGIYYAMLFNLKSFLVIYQLIAQGHKFDIMSIHFSLEAQLARLVRLIYGIPYVMILAGDTPLELIEAKRANGKIQISKFMNNQCEKYGYSAEIIPKGIDLNRYSPQVDATSLINKFNLNSKKVILTMCRLDPRKNLITLIEAAKILKDENSISELVFVIAGDGVEREYLEQKVSEYALSNNFIFAGSVPNLSDEHPMYYSMATLFVLPTLYEGFGWVFLEAMASGVPIITTQAGSNPEVVGDVGVLIPVKSPDQLAEQIKVVVSDTNKHAKMREAGLKKAATFSWDIIAQKLNNYYELISKEKSYTIDKKIAEIIMWIQDMYSIAVSLFKDKVIFNDEKQNYKVEGQKGGLDGSL